MASRVCPYCQGLNGTAETHCYRCKRRLPGPLRTSAVDLVRDALGTEAPMTRLVIGLELVVFALCLITDRSAFERGPLSILFGAFRGQTLVRFGALFGPLVPSEPWRLLSAVF